MSYVASLSSDLVRRLSSFLRAVEVDCLRSTGRGLCEHASDDEVWRDLVASWYWGGAILPPSSVPDAPEGGSRVAPQPSWRVCAYRWRALARVVEGDAEARIDARTWLSIASSWRRLEAWCDDGHRVRQAIGASLRPGASVDALRRVRSRALRYCYAIHDGQELAWDEALKRRDDGQLRRSQDSIFWGLFGGFSAYDYVVCSRFRKLEDARSSDNLFEFAANYRDGRSFAVDDDDVVWVDPAQYPRPGAWFLERTRAGASFVTWFSEYAARLATGVYRVSPLVPDDASSTAVVLFPDAGPDCRVAESNGVRVAASALYIPGHRNGFAYSIRLRLRPDGTPCQLKTRRWLITDAALNQTRTVVGEGVVGKFPKLRHGGWRDDFQVVDLTQLDFERAVRRGTDRRGDFVYQSFSGPMNDPLQGGTFAGTLDFVPNEILHPEGPIFQVTVPEFSLAVPPFIY